MIKMVDQIKKRNGETVNYNRNKIIDAISKAYSASFKERKIDFSLSKTLEKINNLTDLIEKELINNFKDIIPSVEDIQEIVENVLILNCNDPYVVKTYIRYREKHSEIRTDTAFLLDVEKTMDGYLNNDDWRVKENASASYSLGGLILHNSGTVTANYWLNKIYPKYIGDAHKNGDFHIHDLSMFSSYCSGWSLRQLIQEGLGGVDGKIASLPAKHLTTLTNQMVNFIGILQNEWAGAQAFSSVDTLLAPFVWVDNLSYKQTKQCIQSLMFGLNSPSRWASQAPFSNITLDWVIPNDLKDQPAIIGGQPIEKTYSEFQKEMDMINKAFLELFIEGDGNGRGFAYPIPTYNITREFNWDNDNAKLLFEMTGKYGTPYFQNFINSDLNPGDVRSMCPVSIEEQIYIEKDNEPYLTFIKDLIDNEKYNVYCEGEFRLGKFNFHGKKPCYKIRLSNDKSIVVSNNHLNIVHDGENELTLNTIAVSEMIYEKKLFIPVDIIDFIDDENFQIPDLTTEKRSYYEIKSINYIGEKEVACFEMDNEPTFTLASGIITHNCRLQLDKRELLKRGGGLFGANEFTGSIGVVTINMGRIGYLSNSKEDYYKKLEKMMDLAYESLEIKRKIIKKLSDQGLFPYTKRYLRHWNNHFSTIGLIGMNESMLNFMNKNMGSEEAIEFSKEILSFMRNKLIKYQEESGNLYNLEATPGEGTSYRLAKIDKKMYPNIILAGEKDPYYTNSTQLPVNFTSDIFEALDLQNDIQKSYTGGTVFHCYIGESIDDYKITKNLVKKISYNYEIPYFTLSPTYSICNNHGYQRGEVEICPQCGEKNEIYKRIVGYYRSTDNFNKGKAEEHKNRIDFYVPENLLVQ